MRIRHCPKDGGFQKWWEMESIEIPKRGKKWGLLVALFVIFSKKWLTGGRKK
jgi:hypothetical protein